MNKVARYAKAALIAAAILAPGVGTLIGCFAGPDAEPPAAQVDILPPRSAVQLNAVSIVGRWQFVYTPARRAAVEAKLAEKIEDLTELARAKRDAEEEATSSVLQFTRGGAFVSRIGAEEILRAKFTATTLDDRSLMLEIDGDGDAKATQVDFDADLITIHDAEKGDLVFRRVG